MLQGTHVERLEVASRATLSLTPLNPNPNPYPTPNPNPTLNPNAIPTRGGQPRDARFCANHQA